MDDAPEEMWESVSRLDQFRREYAAPPDTLTNAILAGTVLVPLGLVGRRQRFSADASERRVELGMLPVPRRDVERLHQILALQPRLADMRAPVRAQRALLHRHVFQEALTWLEIHGNRPEAVQHWRQLQNEPAAPGEPTASAYAAPRRRRRRRRRAPSGAIEQ
jgi:hypothetical protein